MAKGNKNAIPPNPDNPLKQVKRDTRFKPGSSGNPNGRPIKAKCVSSLLYDLLFFNPDKVTASWPEKHTGAMIVAYALYTKMSKGDLTAINIGLDRAEGKVPTPMAITGDDNGAPIKITYKPAKEAE